MRAYVGKHVSDVSIICLNPQRFIVMIWTNATADSFPTPR